MTSTPIWIGPIDGLELNAVGFLWRFDNTNTGSSRHDVRDTPPYTNRSNEPVLEGWCGTYNDMSTNACGMIRVARLARNGRAYVVPLSGAELTAALDELGYPELDPS